MVMIAGAIGSLRSGMTADDDPYVFMAGARNLISGRVELAAL
jgi:hypothetical protein